MIAVKQCVRQSNCLVRVHPYQLVAPVEDLLLKHLELVSLRRLFLGLLDPTLQHEVLFQNECKTVLHLHTEERAVVMFNEQFHALYIVLLLGKEDQFQRVEVGLHHLLGKRVNLFFVQRLAFP